jgi:hypothetical protein
MRAAVIALAMHLACTAPAAAQVKNAEQLPLTLWNYHEVRKIVEDLAFQPETYFAGTPRGNPRPARETQPLSVLTVVYYGDGWPVWALGVGFGCIQGGETQEGCDARWTARLALAPAPPDYDPDASDFRPRWRGWYAIQRAAALRQADPTRSWHEIVEDLGLVWLETDNRACASATTSVKALASIDWFRPTMIPPLVPPLPPGTPPPPIYSHSDAVALSLSDRKGQLQVYDYAYNNDGAFSWAKRFYEALKPCFRPSTQYPPW